MKKNAIENKNTSQDMSQQERKRYAIMDSFSKLLAHEAKKLLPPTDLKHFDGKPELSIAVLHRFLSSRIFPVPYTVIETNFFKKSLAWVSDKIILAKIEEFKESLRLGSQRINDRSLNKRERFVTSNNFGFFDKNGRFILDFLSDIVGIRHFHVGYDKNTNDNLLFVRFCQDTAFILAVGTHKDVHVDTGCSIVFSAIEEEFPSELDNFFPELKGILPDNTKHSEDELLEKAKVLKSGGVNSFFVDAEGRPRMLGVGFSSARTPTSTTMFIHKVIRELHWIFFENEAYKWFNSPSYIISLEKIDAVPYLISCQRDTERKLRFTFTQLNEQWNISKLIDIIDSVYFSRGKSRKLMTGRIKRRCGVI